MFMQTNKVLLMFTFQLDSSWPISNTAQTAVGSNSNS